MILENPVSPKPRVLIIDDDQAMRDLLNVILKDDYEVVMAVGARDGMRQLTLIDFDIVLLDIRLGDGNGIDLLKQIKKYQEAIEVIMITVVKDLRTAIEAIKYGAYDYINKDFDYDEVKIIINQAIEKRRLKGEVQYLRSEIKQYLETDYVAGVSPAVKEINDIVSRIAKMPSNILIQGESGTGKEIIARRIHNLGLEERSESYRPPFISINIAGIPFDLVESTLFGHEKGSFTGALRTHRGKFELADGGTLFLDEIGELRLELQAKLLRAVQEREIERVGGEHPIKIDVRIIAATNRNLQQMVQQKMFREDLYYRLNVIPIFLPALRERRDDIPLFIDLFLAKYGKRLNKRVTGITPETVAILKAYSWPGNIRELENVIERMVALTDSEILTEEDLPLELRFTDKTPESEAGYEEVLRQATSAFEKRFIMAALDRNNWSQIKTAENLGIHRKTLEYKIKRLNLQAIIEKKRRGLE